ncbi:Pre-mRNA-splicing factor [Hyphodiscus hymeniophilus]|uniref:Pre-mRNA-splicing factor n=1 Tax=Hyphodiscus hymeniophilus TaxID=353542 RepID=A0A9P6SKK0_9HELO|nr:Pre-mRNA-splicing factor [Hyphodiscus hymeniophilus]
MLKSTHQSANAPPPLAEGWTEHKAPTGHTYYYNAATKTSTYTRPVTAAEPTPPAAPLDPSHSFLLYQAVGNHIPSAGPGFNSFSPSNSNFKAVDEVGLVKEVVEEDMIEQEIHGHSLRTNRKRNTLFRIVLLGRFVYNTEKDQSFWRIPEKLKDGILKLDQLRIKEKAEALERVEHPVSTGEAPGAAERPSAAPEANKEAVEGDDSSEYEEVEVTDDEDDEDNPSKRQRTEEPAPDEPVEFDEDDIAFQLAAMGQEYGLERGEYDDGNMEEWDEGAEGMQLSDEDAAALFKDLLNDFGINPYSPWEKLVEEGKLVDDTRYVALTTMKARKEVWEEWTREKIKQLRELRANEEKRDPRLPYLAFLQKHASPKLYWPEFKRKYRKEAAMRDTAMADRDREKLYRDHISRLKLPHSTLKSDLLALLKAQPTAALNNATLASHLPSAILADIRYISLDATTRDPMIEAYISTLPPPPEAATAQEDEEAIKEKNDRERRQKALEDRERRVAEEKRKQKRNLEMGRGRLREEEAEIARAMNVTKKGLFGHLQEDDSTENSGS